MFKKYFVICLILALFLLAYLFLLAEVNTDCSIQLGAGGAENCYAKNELTSNPENVIMNRDGDSCLIKVQSYDYVNDGISWGDIVYIENCI